MKRTFRQVNVVKYILLNETKKIQIIIIATTTRILAMYNSNVLFKGENNTKHDWHDCDVTRFFFSFVVYSTYSQPVAVRELLL